MSLNSNLNSPTIISSIRPANGRQTVGDGAAYLPDNVLAVCRIQHSENDLYYSTTFSGGTGKGGSSGWVTDNLVSNTTKPRPIPTRPANDLHPPIATPPLTPDSGSECGSQDSILSHSTPAQKDPLDFLVSLFPHQGLQALPYAKRLSISAPSMGNTSFDGVLLHYPGQPKTLYVDAKNAELVSLRESIVALLDLADDTLNCSALIIVLERTSPNLGDLLHALMYVGGTVVTKPLFKVDPAFVLVGLEI